MYHLFYKPDEAWVGDVIPYFENGDFYLYYLREKRLNGIPAEKTSWNLVSTKDFIHFNDKGVALKAGTLEDPDRSCYTGSVLKDSTGKYHLFYTAQNSANPKYMKDGRPLQYIMQAESMDLQHWKKKKEFILAACGEHENFDWRDPFVFYNEDEECYFMLIAARIKGKTRKKGGCLCCMKSPDLQEWTVEGDFYAPETYMTHECPDCFKLGDWWYLVFSTFSDKYVTHYRMSKTIDGPWMIPENDTFDGRAFYAAKTAPGSNGKRYLFGWVPTKYGNVDEGKWEWAGNLAVHELSQEKDGTLSVKIPAERFCNLKKWYMPQAFGIAGKGRLDNFFADGTEKISQIMFCELPHHVCIAGKISFSKGISSFGLQFHADESFDCGYFYRFEPLYQRVVFDQWPRGRLSDPVIPNDFENDRPFDAGLERPVTLTPQKPVDFILLLDEDICCIYIAQKIALTARCYLWKQSLWGFFAVGGKIQIDELACCSLEI